MCVKFVACITYTELSVTSRNANHWVITDHSEIKNCKNWELEVFILLNEYLPIS